MDSSVHQTDSSVDQTDSSVDQTDSSVHQTDSSVDQVDSRVDQAAGFGIVRYIPTTLLTTVGILVRSEKSIENTDNQNEAFRQGPPAEGEEEEDLLRRPVKANRRGPGVPHENFKPEKLEGGAPFFAPIDL